MPKILVDPWPESRDEPQDVVVGVVVTDPGRWLRSVELDLSELREDYKTRVFDAQAAVPEFDRHDLGYLVDRLVAAAVAVSNMSVQGFDTSPPPAGTLSVGGGVFIQAGGHVDPEILPRPIETLAERRFAMTTLIVTATQLKALAELASLVISDPL